MSEEMRDTILDAGDVGDTLVAPGVPLSEFSRFAGAAGIPMSCPCCHKETPGWNVYTSKHGNLISPMGIGGEVYVAGGGGVNYVGTSCKNCGFFRAFDLRVVREWIKENPDGKA